MKSIYDILPTLEEIQTIMEIGCHRMTDTALIRGLFPNAKIHCIEPDPRNVALIRSDRLDLMLNVVFYPVALSDRDGTAPFYLSTNLSVDPRYEWTASSSLRPPVNFGSPESLKISPAFYDTTPVEVVCRSLDSLCGEHGIDAIDFIWMDAQGCENLILTGGQRMISKTRYLFTEHNTCGVYSGASDSIGLIKMLPGWELMEMWPYDMLLKNEGIQ